MHWVLTGGSGYIGKELARVLVEQGHAVTTLSRTRSSAPTGVVDVRGDIRDLGSVREVVNDADIVVHLAAFVHKRAASPRMKRECRSINVDGTQNVITAMRERAASAFLVHVSSANVYPDLPMALDESAPTKPRTFYGVTKLESERLVLDAVASGLRAVVLRPAMVFGPRAPGNLARLVRFVERGRVLLLGDGENQKSLLPIETLIAAVNAVVADAHRTNGEIYNVSGGQLSMRAISSLIADELRLAPRYTRLPAWPLRVVGRVVDAASTWSTLPSISQMVTTYASSSVISDAKLRRLPSFRDSAGLESALRTTVRALSASQ
jgi:nucleoside-diphosphate-sugar epimerase